MKEEQLFAETANSCPEDFQKLIGKTLSASRLAAREDCFEIQTLDVSKGRTGEGGHRDQFSVFFKPVGKTLLKSGNLYVIQKEVGIDWLVLFLSPIVNPDNSPEEPRIILEAAFN